MSETADKKEDYPNRIMEQCKILYCQKDLPMTKTCMCWGWECGPGWYPALNVLSCKLEALNLLYYDKYKVRIQADQVKEKFGTLHFYFSVECDNYTERGLELKKLMDDFDEKSMGHPKRRMKKWLTACLSSRTLAQYSTDRYAGGLYFRVRDGTGCCPAALAVLQTPVAWCTI